LPEPPQFTIELRHPGAMVDLGTAQVLSDLHLAIVKSRETDERYKQHHPRKRGQRNEYSGFHD